jgi:hypothetical protein
MPETTSDIHFSDAVNRFNRGEWLESLLLFEESWLRHRDAEHKAFVQCASILKQLHLGYTASPRLLLARAQVLIAESTGTTGIDLADVVTQLQLLQTYLPPVESESFDARHLPVVRLRWLHE